MKTLLMFGLVMLISSAAYAGNGSGAVTFLLTTHVTPTWVVFNVENTPNHACATPNTSLGRFKFTVDSTHGKEMLALLLAAEARGTSTSIVVQGTGTCVEQNRESVDYIYVGNPSL